MKTPTFAGLLVAILSLASAPAMADCAKDLTSLKGRMAGVKDADKLKAAEAHLAAAEKSLKDQNEKACVEALDKAKAAAK
jgi:hypothetical protein